MSKPKLEDIVNHQIGRYLREETVLIHGGFNGNSCDARVIVTFDLPDGRVMTCNKVIRLRFREASE